MPLFGSLSSLHTLKLRALVQPFSKKPSRNRDAVNVSDFKAVIRETFPFEGFRMDLS